MKDDKNVLSSILKVQIYSVINLALIQQQFSQISNQMFHEIF